MIAQRRELVIEIVIVIETLQASPPADCEVKCEHSRGDTAGLELAACGLSAESRRIFGRRTPCQLATDNYQLIRLA